jgi:hypothetical protein
MIDKDALRSCIAENARAIFSAATGVVWALAMLIAVVAGPFGTFEAMTVEQRAVFWGVIISISVVFGYTMRGLACLLVGHDQPMLFDLVATMGMTLLFSPVVFVFSVFFSHLTGVEMPSTTQLVFYVFVISLGVYVLRRLVPGIEPTTYTFLQQESGSVDLPESSEPRLLRRLAPDVQGPVLRLSANDHHVEVVTEAGREVLRLRLADAINEMEPIEGVRPHRSHWVSLDAIEGVERKNAHKVYLTLKNGDKVPVSRSYREKMDEEGLNWTVEPSDQLKAG